MTGPGRLILAFAACLAALLPFGGAAQGTGLRALTDREDVLGWEAVGRLDFATGGFCTATLIAPDLVLTAAHCVFDAGQPRAPGTMLFRAGLHNGTAITERAVTAVAVPPAYRPIDVMDMANVPHDVALLRLSRPITTAEADPFVLFQGDTASSDISTISYGEGRTEVLSRQRSCRLVGRQPPLLAFDCDVTFGSSGAPVFVKVGTRNRILSIISGGARMAETPIAVGMDLPDVVEALKADLRRQGTGQPTPGVRRLGTDDGRSTSGAKFVRPSGS